MSNFPHRHGLEPARLLCPWDFPGKNTVGCHALFQGIVPTQGLKSCLFCFVLWQAGSLPLVPPGNRGEAFSLVFCISLYFSLRKAAPGFCLTISLKGSSSFCGQDWRPVATFPSSSLVTARPIDSLLFMQSKAVAHCRTLLSLVFGSSGIPLPHTFLFLSLSLSHTHTHTPYTPHTHHYHHHHLVCL